MYQKTDNLIMVYMILEVILFNLLQLSNFYRVKVD